MPDEASRISQRRERFLRLGQALNPQALDRLRQADRADLVVGIPSFNNADTIGHVVETAASGIRQYFPEVRAMIVNADGGSQDGTPETVRAAAVPKGVELVSTPYVGPPGKGSALRAVFEAAVLLDASACVVVDSDLRSITPEWIDRLAGPVLRDGFAYVAPYYARHKYDGTITNNIAYPMTSALYGKRVRQPIGGDFGFSGPLARTFLEQDVWESEVVRFGIDIFMTTTALARDADVAEANLGAKVHDPKDPAASLGPMFQQVVGTLFGLMERHADRWQTVKSAQPVPRVGPPVDAEPEPVEVNLDALVARFRQGFRSSQALLEQVLAADTRRSLEWLAGRVAVEGFQFPADVWARACYDFAAAHHRRAASAEALIAALTPLYYGRTAGLVQETATMKADAFEGYIERQMHAFETLKPYLSSRWTS